MRHLGARGLAVAAAFDPLLAVPVLVRRVLPLLEDTCELPGRLGAVEAVYRCIACMGEAMLPYAALLVPAVLAGMSDAHGAIREVATRCFATLLKVLPLENGVADPVGLPADLSEARLRHRLLLQQLWDPAQLQVYPITANISATLRPYQVRLPSAVCSWAAGAGHARRALMAEPVSDRASPARVC